MEATRWLDCADCDEKFEVSASVAEAMHDWRADSGEEFLCLACATRHFRGIENRRNTEENS